MVDKRHFCQLVVNFGLGQIAAFDCEFKELQYLTTEAVQDAYYLIE